MYCINNDHGSLCICTINNKKLITAQNGTVILKLEAVTIDRLILYFDHILVSDSKEKP